MAILVVDDSEDSRKLLDALLRSDVSDEQLLMAASAEEAFRLLGMNPHDAFNSDVNLILMDITMPDINGVEACHAIKAVPAFADLPIIMVTGNEEIEVLDQAFEAGAVDYITKPVNRIELGARVRSALTLKQEVDRRKEAFTEPSTTSSATVSAPAESARMGVTPRFGSSSRSCTRPSRKRRPMSSASTTSCS